MSSGLLVLLFRNNIGWIGRDIIEVENMKKKELNMANI
jgi:hypothetical protein